MGGYLSGGGFRFADSIQFHDSTIDGTGRMGLAITDGATNVSFDHNTLSHIAYYTFDVEPNGYTFNGQAAGAVGVQFTDNTIGTKPYGDYPTDPTQADGYLFAATGSSGGGPAVDITVARNTMTRPDDGRAQDRRVQQRRRAPEHPRRRQHGGGHRGRSGDVLQRRQRADRHRQPAEAVLGGSLATTSGCSSVTCPATSRTRPGAPPALDRNGPSAPTGGAVRCLRVPSPACVKRWPSPGGASSSPQEPSSGSRPSRRSPSGSRARSCSIPPRRGLPTARPGATEPARPRPASAPPRRRRGRTPHPRRRGRDRRRRCHRAAPGLCRRESRGVGDLPRARRDSTGSKGRCTSRAATTSRSTAAAPGCSRPSAAPTRASASTRAGRASTSSTSRSRATGPRPARRTP